MVESSDGGRSWVRLGKMVILHLVGAMAVFNAIFI